tara:strand:- start:7576 stop:7947 length:372 start_codon:yes stop_codon:yes gene_type:complete
MSFIQSRDNRTVLAGADLSTDQFAMVKYDANANAVICGAGEAPLGVLTVPAAATNACTVTVSGVVMVEVGTGGITLGANAATNASGHVIAATTNDVIVGTALEAGAVGNIIAMDISLANNISA